MRSVGAFLVAVIVICGSVGCTTEPGEKTGLGALTGGFIGAGLGAIIGSQSGDPGTGLVLGSLAGSAAGAAVGNVFEAQEKELYQREEAISKQAERIRIQQQNIDKLKRANSDIVAFNQNTNNRDYLGAGTRARMSDQAPRRVAVAQELVKQPETGFRSADITTAPMISQRGEGPVEVTKADGSQEPLTFKSLAKSEIAKAQEQGNLESAKFVANSATPMDHLGEAKKFEQTQTAIAPVAAIVSQGGVSIECNQARDEASKAKVAQEQSDKLFHFRRALRLCPQDPALHVGLGEVYIKLGRRADAQFEFKQALRLDSTNSDAQKNLDTITQENRY